MGWVKICFFVILGVWFLWQGSKTLSLMPQNDFKIAFWANVYSSLLITVMVAIFINYFTPLFKHPELIIVVKQNSFYSNKIKITQKPDGNYEASFRLAIKNIGSKTFRANGGYWHVYFPSAEKIETLNGAGGFIAQGENNHLRDLINLPVYPKSFLDFGPEYKLLIKKDALRKTSIRYFFETDYGYFPNSVRLDQKTGAVLFSDMGSIEFEQPD
ncbi:hypothetical protein EPN54_02645 [bacterium]|nr:MAG: hypothetical protein EPN54_02645 [bacterium]